MTIVKTEDDMKKWQTKALREELLKFNAKNYIASNMKLCVVGNQNLDTLSRLVERYFSDVPDQNTLTKETKEIKDLSSSAAS